MARRWKQVAFVCALPIASLAVAQQPRLVRDIEPQFPSAVPADEFRSLRAWGSLGRKALFSGLPPHGNANVLWATEGTAASTQPVAHLEIGARSRAANGGLVYFRDSGPGRLSRTDGTAAGTFELVPEFGTCESWGLLEDVLYFSIREGAASGLWRIQGTPASTRRVASIPHVRGCSEEFVVLGSQLYFLAGNVVDSELWTSDGTTAGTVSVSQADAIATAGGRLIFRTVVSTGIPGVQDLWALDPHTDATTKLARISSVPWTALRTLGAKAYFLTRDEQYGTQLWRTDGTPQGTVPAADLPPAPENDSVLASLQQAGPNLFFVAADETGDYQLWSGDVEGGSLHPLQPGCGAGCLRVDGGTTMVPIGPRVVFADATEAGPRLWVSDGTAAGTRYLAPGSAALSDSNVQAALGGAFFTRSSSYPAASAVALWFTDGTPAGTRRLIDLGDITEPEVRMVVAAGWAYFAVQHDPVSLLYRTNGTPPGTEQITTLWRQGLGSGPGPATARDGQAYFVACRDDVARLWRSGGTESSTQAVSNPLAGVICVGEAMSPQLQVTFSGGHAFLSDSQGVPHELWSVDLLDGTTSLLFSSPYSSYAALFAPMPVAGGASFLARGLGPGHSLDLWTSDGTLTGTRIVKTWDFSSFGLFAHSVRAFGVDRFILSTDDGQLWVSDGTEGGTIALGPALIGGGPLVMLGGVGYFLGSASSTSGPGLWRTNGTSLGTWEVVSPAGTLDIREGRHNLAALGNRLFFTARTSATTWGIWSSDGSAAGTVPIVDVAPSGPYGATYFSELTAAGDLLFFKVEVPLTTRDPRYDELWVTDGTAAGTRRLGAVLPHYYYELSLTAFAGKVAFQGLDEAHGFELWQSDGTSAGTRILGDIAPGGQSSEPRYVRAIGDDLYFSANDALHGREPWVVRTAANPACEPSANTLCLRQGRFEVTTQWRDFQGNSGPGHAVALTADTGYFWFFNSANVETVLKVLDGRGLNDHHWVFYGALSNVEYWITVRDTSTGASRRYYNQRGAFASVGDTGAFGPLGSYTQSRPQPLEPQPPLVTRQQSSGPLSCVPSAQRLCLNGGRFAVTATWRDFSGRTGAGMAVGLTSDTGTFWFFSAANVEVVLKVLDGRPVNGKFWVFYGALSNVEYMLTVTDTATGAVRTYRNPSGRFASIGDTDAF